MGLNRRLFYAFLSSSLFGLVLWGTPAFSTTTTTVIADGRYVMADGDTLSLAAVYRSHDYFHKALGNFVGLSRLLSYVCSKTGHAVGTLTCHSAYAFLGAKRTATAKLLQNK